MAKTVVLDELHLVVRVPAALPDETVRTIRRVLTGRQFESELKQAVRAVIRDRKVRVALAR